MLSSQEGMVMATKAVTSTPAVRRMYWFEDDRAISRDEVSAACRRLSGLLRDANGACSHLSDALEKVLKDGTLFTPPSAAPVGDLLPLLKSPDRALACATAVMLETLCRCERELYSAWNECDQTWQPQRRETDVVLEALASSDVDEVDFRAHLACILGYGRGDRVVTPLVRLLDDKVARVRRAAADSLRYIGDETAFPALLARLEDEDMGVRGASAMAIGLISRNNRFCDHPVEAIVRALEDVESEVRCAAARALAAMDDTRTVTPLLARLNDTVADVRLEVARALGFIFRGHYWREHPQSSLMLAGYNTVCKALCKGAANADANVRNACLFALAPIGSRNAVRLLMACLLDPESRIRRGAVCLLAGIARRWLRRPSAGVRCAALKAVVAIGGEGAFEAILKCFATDVRVEVARWLGEREASSATGPLLAVLKDKDPSVREEAVKSLRELECQGVFPWLLPRVLPSLSRLLEDEDPSVRAEVVCTLR